MLPDVGVCLAEQPSAVQIMLLSALGGTEMTLLDAGVSITPGAGVGAAVKHLQSTSSYIRGRELKVT